VPGPTLRRIVVSVESLGRSLAFYRDGLGLRVASEAPGFAWLGTADDVEIMLHERAAVPSDASVTAGFGVAGIAATTERALAAGGTLVEAPARQPWGERMSILRDPDGHLVCLYEPAAE
jgi:catechol 2,3-dioxygenase-like lactoylglutathione lyase family enzyme